MLAHWSSKHVPRYPHYHKTCISLRSRGNKLCRFHDEIQKPQQEAEMEATYLSHSNRLRMKPAYSSHSSRSSTKPVLLGPLQWPRISKQHQSPILSQQLHQHPKRPHQVPLRVTEGTTVPNPAPVTQEGFQFWVPSETQECNSMQTLYV